MKMEWESKYEVHVDKIDSQHKELFKMVNRLIEAAESGGGREEIVNLLKFLETYVIEHFSLEEEFMKRYEYPGYERHKGQHNAFIANFLSLKKCYDSWGISKPFMDLVEKWVFNWLKDHILTVDKEFTTFIRSKGITKLE